MVDVEVLKLRTLKMRIGKILKENGYRLSQTIMYGRTTGYYYDGVYGSQVAKQSCLSYEVGNPYGNARTIKQIHQILMDAGMSDYIESLNEGDEIIKFKNVK